MKRFTLDMLEVVIQMAIFGALLGIMSYGVALSWGLAS